MDIKLPNLGEGAESGTVLEVFVNEGDYVTADQAIIELESEKAIASMPAGAEGTVQKILVQPGQVISAGTVLMSLSSNGSEKAAPSDAVPEPSETPPAAQPAADTGTTANSPSLSASGLENVSLDVIPDSVPMPAAPPSVRFIASQLGLDLRRVVALTGGNRVSIADLKQYLDSLQKLAVQASQAGSATPSPSASAAVAESIDFSQWGEILKKPMSQLRQVIARRMQENWQSIPHVTQFDEVDMSRILDLRKKFKDDYEKEGARLTVTPFILKALADTLKNYPEFNSSLDEGNNEIVLKQYIHLGLAVDSEEGLMVPVIRDADKKSLLDLSREVVELAEKARDRKLTADEMRGGTFTISNQGAFGGGHFTPIVNKPEVAILGLGRSSEKAVIRDGSIEARPVMPITLSYDHRVIDGGSAARFIVDLVKAFENIDDSQVSL